jgi:hypothetical protein
MRVYVACVLNCPPDRVWNEVQKSALLREVCRPLIRFAPVDPPQFPDTWIEGGTIRCRSFLFGFIPLGTRTLFAERIDQAAHEIQSRERDPLIRRWDHLIRVRPADGGRTRYSDEIVIEAGMITPLVWSFAQWFYRHRQRRWHRVAQRLAR